MNKEALATRLRTTFVAELEDQLRAMNADLLALEKQPTDGERLKSLFRVAHTLKGAARAAGVGPVEQACHALEGLLAKARDGVITLGPSHFTQLFSAADALADAGTRLREGAATPATPAPIPSAGTTPVGGVVRMPAEKLDALLASAEQLLALNSRSATRATALQALRDDFTRHTADWERVGRRLRLVLEQPGRSPVAAQDVVRLQQNLRELVQEVARSAAGVSGDGRQLSQATRDLLYHARRLRMRAFGEACEALPRAVRDLAVAAEKEVDLVITGGEVEADGAVLDGLRDALLHLVRNAVDHGIEGPAQRGRAGKPKRGTITVAAVLRGDRLIVTVADDGAGLNLSAVQAQLERKGLPCPQDPKQLVGVLMRGGISTRVEATPISGRGVGLDLARATMERLRGSLDVVWQEGRGTTFVLECAPTLTTVRAILARVASQTLAIPTTQVERLMRVRPETIQQVEGRDVIPYPTGPVPLVALARLLPPLAEKPARGTVPLVVLRDGERRLAVAVDEVLAEQEIVVRPLNHRKQHLPLVSGAVLLGTGQVALVLNPGMIIAAGLDHPTGTGITVAPEQAAAAVKRRILVVEDSITTRTLEQSVLEAAGYDVLAAVDGVDAWRLLQEKGCDAVVADIEMPRMDGFALCQAIRSSTRFKSLPVVLVTALETAEHRSRGLEAGADAYIGKSRFEQQDLLETIRQLLG